MDNPKYINQFEWLEFAPIVAIAILAAPFIFLGWLISAPIWKILEKHP